MFVLHDLQRKMVQKLFVIWEYRCPLGRRHDLFPFFNSYTLPHYSLLLRSLVTTNKYALCGAVILRLTGLIDRQSLERGWLQLGPALPHVQKLLSARCELPRLLTVLQCGNWISLGVKLVPQSRRAVNRSFFPSLTMTSEVHGR